MSLRLSCLRLVAALTVSYPLFCAQAPQTFRIAGHLVRHADNRPIHGARVVLTKADERNRKLQVITGENGEFFFTDLPLGKYQLQATYRGWRQLFQQDEEFSTAIAVGPEEDTHNVIFVFDSPASISGTVVDEDGEPVRWAQAQLFRQGVMNGTFATQMQGAAQTKTNGSFRFGNLSAGTYFVAVSGRPWYAQNRMIVNQSPLQQQDGSAALLPQQEQPPSDLDVAYQLTYYADTTSPEAATPLKLSEGMDAEIEFQLRAVPAVHITLEDGQSHPELQVMTNLSQVGPGGLLIQTPSMSMGGTVQGIAPGNYVLTAQTLQNQQWTNLGSQTVSASGDTTIRLSDDAKISFSGKVIFDGDVVPNLSVWLRNPSNGGGVSARVEKDGSFKEEGIQPGKYSLLLANSQGFYVDKASASGAELENGQLTVVPGSQIELTIKAGKGLSNVNGRVTKDKKNLSGALVLLIPQDRVHGNYMPRDQSDSDGTFTLFNAPPGRYTLIAITNGRGLSYADPAVIAPYLANGKALEVPLPKGATVEIEAQPRLR